MNFKNNSIANSLAINKSGFIKNLFLYSKLGVIYSEISTINFTNN